MTSNRTPSSALEAPSNGGIFWSFTDIVREARPMGEQRVRKLMATDPRAPKPIMGGDRPGSGGIYSAKHARAFLESVATEGLVTTVDA